MTRVTLGAVLMFTDEFDATVAFLTDTVGLRAADVDPGQGYEVGSDFLGFETGGPLLEVFASAVHTPPTADGAAEVVLAFQTDDLASARQSLCDKGAEVITEEIDRDWGTYLYLTDPAGRPIQLYAEKQ